MNEMNMFQFHQIQVGRNPRPIQTIKEKNHIQLVFQSRHSSARPLLLGACVMVG